MHVKKMFVSGDGIEIYFQVTSPGGMARQK